jgi:hypothetical protein
VYDGLSGSIPAPEVSFAEITADLLEARLRCYNNVVDMAAQSACNSQREQATCDSGWLDSRPANAAGAEQIA